MNDPPLVRCVLGLDPGIATFGYALVGETATATADLVLIKVGAITTPSSHPMAERLWTIFRQLSGLISEYGPTEAALEEFLFALNPRTALNVGQARGVALLALATAGIPIAEYEPSVVKQFVAGKGNARKQQVGEQVKIILRLPEVPTPDDAADAAAIAICHLLHVQVWSRVLP